MMHTRRSPDFPGLGATVQDSRAEFGSKPNRRVLEAVQWPVCWKISDSEQVVDHQEWITRRNIELFENLLEQSHDHEQLRIVGALLDAERGKLLDQSDTKSEGNISEGNAPE